jgi:hypothetical protein
VVDQHAVGGQSGSAASMRNVKRITCIEGEIAARIVLLYLTCVSLHPRSCFCTQHV